MAKAKVKHLDEAIDRLFKRYESNLRKAMQTASDEAEFDIRLEAESCLARYYDNYDPNWYHRTESLIQAFVSYNNINKNKNKLVAKVGMGYDPSRLDGLYYSNASQKAEFNPVDSSWILSNYLNGIHPRTNGYPLYADELEYIPIQDAVSPNEHMNVFLQEYVKTFDSNVLKSFAKYVITRR